jgi:hypothetical protein
MKIWNVALAAAGALACGSAAQATEFVVNGHFDQDTLGTAHEFGASHDGQTLVGWTSADSNAFNLYFPVGTATGPTDADTRFGEHGQFLHVLPGNADPDGGPFVALDGDESYNGALTQEIHNLVVGKQYNLTFFWAAAQYADRTGDTTDQLEVSLGGDTFFTSVINNPSASASNWFTVHHTFTATGADEVLSFLSHGTPSGLPPVALLDGVSLTGGVPEPAAWALMLIGFGGLGATLRRRRALAA